MSKSSGFSLIELLIVLGLAGLIIATAFYGINQANRDKRDDARKTDVGRYLEAEKQWVSD